MDQEETRGINFDLPKNRSNVIKVIGVGGGGSNAINYMFKQGIKGVDFVITNTDSQALSESGVPTKIQLGASLTEGLGAGANPEVGARAAKESQKEIEGILSTQTKMIFITAGMGGGTGTGAAPVIAEMAKSMDILTVGIVTMPFQFEGRLRLEQAQKGLERIKESVDALIVINNNKLREVYGNLGFKAGFAKADEVLATAARGIAEVITHHYTQNIDLKDAKTVLTNSGTAIMGSALSSGSNRAQEAIVKALDSPLLNDNKITGCKNVLLLIVSGSDEITIDEIGEINDYIQTEAGNHTNIIMGVGEDENLGNEISVTVIATGFGIEQQNEISNTETKKIIHSLEDEQKIVHNLIEDQEVKSEFNQPDPTLSQNENEKDKKEIIDEEPLIPMNDILSEIEVEAEVVTERKKQNKYNNLSSEEGKPVYSVIDDSKIKKSDILNEKQDYITEIDNANENLEESLFKPEFNTIYETEEKIDNSSQKHELDENITSESNDFVFNDITKSVFEIEVTDPEEISGENQILLDFELPFSEDKENEKEISNNLNKKQEIITEDANLDNNDLQESSIDVEFELKNSLKDNTENKKIEDTVEKISNHEDKINPFEQSINQTIASQSEKRKSHLEAFNHKFTHQFHKIDEMEKEPAYKRKGLDVNSDVQDSPSRLSVDKDNNDDLQIRSNNSFLHDNVD